MRLYLPVCLQAHLGHLFGNIPFEAAPLWEGLQASWTPRTELPSLPTCGLHYGQPLAATHLAFYKMTVWTPSFWWLSISIFKFNWGGKNGSLPTFCKEKFSSKGLSEIWTKIQSFSHCDIQKLETNYTSTSKIQSKFLKPLKLVFK